MACPSLHLGGTGEEGLNSIHSLVFAALLISVGRAKDRWGRKRMFLAGILVFVCSSLLAAIAPNGETLIFARSLQGVGGAMILSVYPFCDESNRILTCGDYMMTA